MKKKYNPELQKRALENREVRQEQFNNFVLQLKEHSRSDKSSKSLFLFCDVSNWLPHMFNDSPSSCLPFQIRVDKSIGLHLASHNA